MTTVLSYNGDTGKLATKRHVSRYSLLSSDGRGRPGSVGGLGILAEEFNLLSHRETIKKSKTTFEKTNKSGTSLIFLLSISGYLRFAVMMQWSNSLSVSLPVSLFRFESRFVTDVCVRICALPLA